MQNKKFRIMEKMKKKIGLTGVTSTRRWVMSQELGHRRK